MTKRLSQENFPFYILFVFHKFPATFQEQLSRGVIRKKLSQNMQQFTGEYPFRSENPFRCSPVTFQHIFKIPLYKKTYVWLLLYLVFKILFYFLNFLGIYIFHMAIAHLFLISPTYFSFLYFFTDSVLSSYLLSTTCLFFCIFMIFYSLKVQISLPLCWQPILFKLTFYGTLGIDSTMNFNKLQLEI